MVEGAIVRTRLIPPASRRGLIQAAQAHGQGRRREKERAQLGVRYGSPRRVLLERWKAILNAISTGFITVILTPMLRAVSPLPQYFTVTVAVPCFLISTLSHNRLPFPRRYKIHLAALFNFRVSDGKLGRVA
ncbi:MAG: hypothetical protein LBJ12_03645 [Oscillospiraceae bacterium]|nr:hypothetical protein [Oscillospiraceae bacterium]